MPTLTRERIICPPEPDGPEYPPEERTGHPTRLAMIDNIARRVRHDLQLGATDADNRTCDTCGKGADAVVKGHGYCSFCVTLLVPDGRDSLPVISDRGEWFASAREAAAAVGGNAEAIQSAIHNGWRSVGRKWSRSEAR